MGFVYVSNLIVGTGALTMPLAIAKAGLWISIPMLGNDMILLSHVGFLVTGFFLLFIIYDPKITPVEDF